MSYCFGSRKSYKVYPEIHYQDLAIVEDTEVLIVPNHAPQILALKDFPRRVRWTVLLIDRLSSDVYIKEVGSSEDDSSAKEEAKSWMLENIENYKKTPEEVKQDREAAMSLTVVDAVSVGNSFESTEE